MLARLVIGRRCRSILLPAALLLGALVPVSLESQDTVPRPPTRPIDERPAPQVQQPVVPRPPTEGQHPGARPPAMQPAPASFPLDTLAEVRDTLEGPAWIDEPRLPPEQALPWIPEELGHLRIFGRDLFTRATSQFQPVSTGPVDSNYRLGPGDQLLLVLTGDVDVAHTLEVSREGTVVVPQVGVVAVQGLTIRELEDRLHARLSQVLAGVGRGPGATTQLSASLGRLRANQVFLAGEVERPGAYQVSSVATAFTALYQARGPNVSGSFRRIEVRRGGSLVRTVDVYDYILRGESRNDVRLDQGDILFVPLAGRQVAIAGSVRRPAIYELTAGEDLRDLLAFSGGLDAAASIARIQIDRILPYDQRQPGVERVLIDVDLAAFLRGGSYALHDQDVVRVFTVGSERRNRIVLDGDVRRPGVYEYTRGMRLTDVIARAEGLEASAYTPRAHIYRLNRQDGSRFLLTAPLGPDSLGAPAANPELADADSIVIYSLYHLRTARVVRIHGMVREPGAYELAEGMTVRDLILAAGGFRRGADATGVELARRNDTYFRTDTLAAVQRIELDAAGAPWASMESVWWVPGEQEMVLQADDQVMVRRLPGFEAPRVVYVLGEVHAPGPYVLETRQTRLLDMLDRAGGPTNEADLGGLRVIREGLLIGTGYHRAAQRSNSRFNVVLQHGDSIVLPQQDPTVQVVGAVAFESRVVYRPGLTVMDYISQSGGLTRLADRGRISITYADGSRAILRRRGLWGSSPPVRPGSYITVPERPEAPSTNWGDVLTRTVSVVGSILTLVVAVDRLNR